MSKATSQITTALSVALPAVAARKNSSPAEVLRASLDRTATDLQQEGLGNKFDTEKVQRDLVAGQIAGQVTFRATGDLAQALADEYRKAQAKAISAQAMLDALGEDATPELRDQLRKDIADANAAMAANQAQYDLWKDGGAGKTLLHAVAGAVVAGSGGDDVLSGALGAGAAELGRPITDEEGNLIRQLVSAALGAVGGETGVATGLEGEQYNRQLHPDEVKLINANALAFAQSEFGCEEQCTTDQVNAARQRLLIQAVRQVDEAWNKMLGHKGLTAQDGNAQTFLDKVGKTTGDYTYFAADYYQRADQSLFADKLQGTKELAQLYGAIISTGKTEAEQRNLLQALNRVDAGWRDDFANGVISRDAWTILTTFTGGVGFVLEVTRKVATGDVEGAVKDVATAFAVAKIAGQLGRLIPSKGAASAPTKPVAEAVPTNATPAEVQQAVSNQVAKEAGDTLILAKPDYAVPQGYTVKVGSDGAATVTAPNGGVYKSTGTYDSNGRQIYTDSSGAPYTLDGGVAEVIEIPASSALAREGLRNDLASQAGIPRSLDQVWGSSLEDLAQAYKMDGATLVPVPPRPGSSGNAQVLKIEGHPTMKEVQYHPGGGVHGEAPYYKFTYKDGTEVRVIDPTQKFNPGTITKYQQYFDPQGNRLKYEGGEWKLWQ